MPDAAETTNIIGEKYRNKYKNNQDWIGEMIAKHCTRPDGDDKAGQIDLDRLFRFAQVNGIDTENYEAQADRPHAPGRLRMTIGNMLRARAKRRHGLNSPDGKRLKASDDFLADAPEAVEKLDGTPTPAAKAAEAEKAAAKAATKATAKAKKATAASAKKATSKPKTEKKLPKARKKAA